MPQLIGGGGGGGGRELHIGSGEGTQVPLVKPPQPITRIGVQLVDAVHILACSEILVMASTTDMGSENMYLVESNGGQVGALVAMALAKPKGGGVPVNLGWNTL